MNKIPKKNLIDALGIYKNTFSNNELIAIDIRNNICQMDVDTDQLSLRISFDVEKQKDTKKQLVIETSRLLNFLKSGTHDLLEILTDVNHTLKIDKSELCLPVSKYVVQDWNKLKNKKDVIEVSSSRLLAQVARVLSPFTVGAHHNALNNICIRKRDDELELLGTDSFKIGIVHLTKESLNSLSNIDVVVSSSVLSILSRLLKSNESCSMFMVNKSLGMEINFGVLKLEVLAPPPKIDYPDIKPLITNLPDYEWEVSSSDFIRCCTLHKNVGTNTSAATTLIFKDKSIGINTINGTEISTEVENVKRISGKGNKAIKLSLKFIMDSIKLIALNNTENIRIGYNTKMNLVWMRADSNNEFVKTMAIIVPVL